MAALINETAWSAILLNNPNNATYTDDAGNIENGLFYTESGVFNQRRGGVIILETRTEIQKIGDEPRITINGTRYLVKEFTKENGGTFKYTLQEL